MHLKQLINCWGKRTDTDSLETCTVSQDQVGVLHFNRLLVGSVLLHNTPDLTHPSKYCIFMQHNVGIYATKNVRSHALQRRCNTVLTERDYRCTYAQIAWMARCYLEAYRYRMGF